MSLAATGDEDGVDLTALGWDERWAAVLARLPGTPGRVTRVDRGRLRVVGPDVRITVPRPAEGPSPVTGDWVGCDAGDDHPRITGIAPRRTALVRRDPAESTPRPQVLAANMDEVWIVQAVDQPLRPGWIDRALVVAYGSGAQPLVVVAKSDLADATAVTAGVVAAAPTTPVLTASTTSGDGIPELRARLTGGRCAALLGRSGAGKSSLINALVGADAHRTAAVRPGDARGRHTTTRRSLTPVAGGSVIDTPGVRALGLWQPDAGLAATFPDIAALAAMCHFADCSHRHEPGCAVLAACDRGDLDSRRYQRYITLSD